MLPQASLPRRWHAEMGKDLWDPPDRIEMSLSEILKDGKNQLKQWARQGFFSPWDKQAPKSPRHKQFSASRMSSGGWEAAAEVSLSF